MYGQGVLPASVIAAQHRVQRTAGSLRDLEAFFWLRFFSTSQTFSTPAHTPLTQTVRQFLAKKSKILLSYSQGFGNYLQ
jgi:hypothetical protein